MILSFQHHDSFFEFDSKSGTNLAIPIEFSDNYLSAFGVGRPTKKPFSVEGFVGSVKSGGSCNCEVVEIIPHCHTTHTECVGHVLEDPLFVPDVLKECFFLANLLTVSCESDFKISEKQLEDADIKSFSEALIIRTNPNDVSKKSKQYSEKAPYLSVDAIEWMSKKGLKHLLVDFPSIDPIWDGGKLLAHRAFWNLTEGQNKIDSKTWTHKTLTELIYVPESVPDGLYALDLQTSQFNLDAVPSTPILYPCKQRKKINEF